MLGQGKMGYNWYVIRFSWVILKKCVQKSKENLYSGIRIRRDKVLRLFLQAVTCYESFAKLTVYRSTLGEKRGKQTVPIVGDWYRWHFQVHAFAKEEKVSFYISHRLFINQLLVY